MADLTTLDDAQLAARCKQGEPAAWRVLVQRYQRLVYAVARRGGLDEHGAADVFQTVFTRLLEALPRIAQPDRLQAWIVTTAKREVFLLLKRARRTVSMTATPDAQGEFEEWDVADETPLPEDLLGELQQLHALRLGLDRLDKRCRDLLELLFADDEERLSYDEISARLDMPAGSIGPTRSRCLGKLRVLTERQL